MMSHRENAMPVGLSTLHVAEFPGPLRTPEVSHSRSSLHRSAYLEYSNPLVKTVVNEHFIRRPSPS